MKANQVNDIAVKKHPKQARSKATFDAIIQASAWVLIEDGYAAVTTNRIAERAGVNIASLYEYFPNKESIIAILAERELTDFMQAMSVELQPTNRVTAGTVADLSDAQMVMHMLSWGIGRVREQRGLLSILLLDVPFVISLPAVQTLMASAVTVIQQAVTADERLHLPDIEINAWLLVRMCFNTAMEIASSRVDDERREKLKREFARFCFRMLFARDPDDPAAWSTQS